MYAVGQSIHSDGIEIEIGQSTLSASFERGQITERTSISRLHYLAARREPTATYRQCVYV